VTAAGRRARTTTGSPASGASVRISGSEVRVRAQVRRMDNYSAHADQGELLDWVAHRSPISGTLFLDHGELDGLEAMRRELQRRVPELTVCLPKIGETYSLPSGNAARRLTTGRPDAESAIGRDWQNAYAELVSGLKGDLGLIPEERRQEAIDRLREVLRSYNAFRDNHRAES